MAMEPGVWRHLHVLVEPAEYEALKLKLGRGRQKISPFVRNLIVDALDHRNKEKAEPRVSSVAS